MKLTKQKLYKLIEEVLTEGRDCDSAVTGNDLRVLKNKRSLERRPDGGPSDELLGLARTHGQKGLKLPRIFAKEQEVYNAWVEGMLEYINWVDRCDSRNPLPPNFMGHHYLGYEEEALSESKMKTVTGFTLQAYLDPKFGMEWGTALDVHLKRPKVLRKAARASAIHEKPFPEEELKALFSHMGINPEPLIDMARNAYNDALRTGKHQ